MNNTAFALALVGVAAFPTLAQAREITLQTTLKEYRGNEAYLAIYVTDAEGSYQRTLWVAGKKAKYYKHLRDWARAGNKAAEYDGLTGASVGSGETLEVVVELEDALESHLPERSTGRLGLAAVAGLAAFLVWTSNTRGQRLQPAERTLGFGLLVQRGLHPLAQVVVAQRCQGQAGGERGR